MTKGCGLTEKRMMDKRFRQTEETLFRIVCAETEGVDVGKMIEEAGISRTTFYRHHSAPYNIVLDYEDFVYDYYRSLVRNYDKETSAKKIFYQTAVFVRRHEEVIDLVVERGGERIFKRMMGEVLPQIAEEYEFSGSCVKMKEVYLGEIVGILKGWWCNEFCDKEIGRVVSDLMFLTRTAKKRLEPLN